MLYYLKNIVFKLKEMLPRCTRIVYDYRNSIIVFLDKAICMLAKSGIDYLKRCSLHWKFHTELSREFTVF